MRFRPLSRKMFVAALLLLVSVSAQLPSKPPLPPPRKPGNSPLIAFTDSLA